MCMCISFRPAVGHIEASGAQRNPKLHVGHNCIAEQQEPQECEEQEAIVQILPSELVSSSVQLKPSHFKDVLQLPSAKALHTELDLWRMKWKS